MAKKTLRKYQAEGILAVKDAFKNKGINCQILAMATGTGKTFTASYIVKKFRNCLWITHTEELIEQSALAIAKEVFQEDKELLKLLKKIETEIGVIDFFKNTQKENDLFTNEKEGRLKKNLGLIKRDLFQTESRVTVASIQTLHRRINKINPDHFDLIIVDECHLCAAKTWTKTTDHFEPRLLLGLTATPRRDDNLSLSNIFDEIVYKYSILDGIKDGYLKELNGIQIQSTINLDTVKKTGGDFNKKELKIVDCPERNQLIVNRWKKYSDGRPTVVFAVDVDHAIHLTETFQLHGIDATFVVGDEKKCPNRKERIKKFKAGVYTVIVNCMILTTGFDYPDIGCIIMACPTQSLTKFIQCIGRGTRKSERYKECHILDITDSTNRHKLINTWSLDKGKKAKEKVFVTSEKRKKLKSAEKKRRKLKSERKKDKRVDLFELPKPKIIKSKRMRDPATKKQLKWLESLGFDIENKEWTKGQCSEVISQQPATKRQVEALRKLRYNVDVSGGVTRGEAQAAFEEFEKKKEKNKEEKKITAPAWKQKSANNINFFKNM